MWFSELWYGIPWGLIRNAVWKTPIQITHFREHSRMEIEQRYMLLLEKYSQDKAENDKKDSLGFCQYLKSTSTI